jgi:transposase
MMTMRVSKHYDYMYKIEAVKLADGIGAAKAIRELNLPESTLYTWIRQAKDGELDAGIPQKPHTARRLASELVDQRKKNRQLEMELREKDRVIACLKEATAFFARSQKK